MCANHVQHSRLEETYLLFSSDFLSSFRLGFLGNLTSTALRSAGYKPNNQLRDQRVAFAWIQKHIAGFGGIPGEITVAGESSGAGLEPKSQSPIAKPDS